MRTSGECARQYFEALAAGDPKRIPYAERVEFWTPLGPNGLSAPIVGAAATRDFLAAVAPLIKRVDVLNVFEERDWCAVRAHLELSQPAATVLHVMDIFRVVDGQISFQENHFDPRPAMPK